MRRARRIIATAAVAAAVVPAGAQAHKIEVHHGDSLSNAVAHAHSGDVILIHPGTYHDALTIQKKLKLVGVGATRPIIDADCQANDAIDVLHGGVTVTGLQVQGAAEQPLQAYPAEVFFEGVPSGKASNLRVINTCNAEYGVSAFGTGPVQVTNTYSRDFDDSGIYIGGIQDTLGGTLVVEDNKAVQNSRGIIVENSSQQTDISVRGNVMNHNTIAGSEGPSDGLFLNNADGVLIADNTAKGNAGSGFHASSNSHNNVFKHNTAAGNGDQDFNDEGSGNCGRDNSFTVPSC